MLHFKFCFLLYAQNDFLLELKSVLSLIIYTNLYIPNIQDYFVAEITYFYLLYRTDVNVEGITKSCQSAVLYICYVFPKSISNLKTPKTRVFIKITLQEYFFLNKIPCNCWGFPFDT